MKITTFPMVHIGSRDYYREIADGLERSSFVLTEGVTWKRAGHRTKLYDLAARNLGLVAQSDVLQYPEQASRIHIDMPDGEFRKRFLRIPIRYRLLLRFLRPLLWVLTVIPKLRRALMLGLVEKDASQFRRRGKRDPLDELVEDARDEVIVANIRRFYEEHGQQATRVWASIVFGAYHMDAIGVCLSDLGFHPGTRKWLTAFGLREDAG